MQHGWQENFKVKSASREVGTLGNQQCMSQTIETCKCSWMCPCLVFVLEKCYGPWVFYVIVIHHKNPKPSQAHPERRKQVWTEQTAGGPTKQNFKAAEDNKLSERVKVFSYKDWLIPSLEGMLLVPCMPAWQEALPKSRTLSNKGCVRHITLKAAHISPSASFEICRSERQQCQEPSAEEMFIGFHISSKTFKGNSN